MASALYSTLKSSLNKVVVKGDASRKSALAKHAGAGPLPPLDPAELKKVVGAAWDAASAKAPAGASSSTSRAAEVIRSTLDLVGRDVAVRPVIDLSLPEPADDAPDADKARFQTALQDRLDIVLTLYEVAFEAMPDLAYLEPGAIFIPLLEDFVELLSVGTWHELFGYMETRQKRFTKNMPASRGKALPLLRTINAFLRFLSHTPEDLRMKGRVQLFTSSAISIADKSATNLRGEYSNIMTTWEKDEPTAEAEEEVDGDVKMEDEKDEKEEKEKEPAQPDFYSTLWSLQQFFAFPPSLDGPAVGEPPQSPFDEFRTKSDFVLSRLYEQTRRERVLLGRNPERTSRKRPRETTESYPRYLTAKSLLEYEITDTMFRRQVLVQYFILFQFLLNLTPTTADKQQFTGGMPKTFVIDGDSLSWIKTTVSAIRQELQRMSPEGPHFEKTVVSLMDRERRYAQWKNDGCPESEWELHTVDPKVAEAAADKWRRHQMPMRKWPYRYGTASLTNVWDRGYKSMDNFKTPVQMPTVFELEEKLRKIEEEEEDDKAMGRDPPPENAEIKRTIQWCALREIRRSHPRISPMVNGKYDLHEVVKAINGLEAKRAAAKAKASGLAVEDSTSGAGTPAPEDAGEDIEGIEAAAQAEAEAAAEAAAAEAAAAAAAAAAKTPEGAAKTEGSAEPNGEAEDGVNGASDVDMDASKADAEAEEATPATSTLPSPAKSGAVASPAAEEAAEENAEEPAAPASPLSPLSPGSAELSPAAAAELMDE